MTEQQKYPRRFKTFNRYSCRLKVPGGWLVWLFKAQGGPAFFYPDPNHEWVLEDES